MIEAESITGIGFQAILVGLVLVIVILLGVVFLWGYFQGRRDQKRD